MEVMTEEERQNWLELSDKILKAYDAGDDEKFKSLVREVEAPAHVLMETKQAFGADWIREAGINTKQADEKYGADWLER